MATVPKCDVCSIKGVPSKLEVLKDSLFSCSHTSDLYQICTVCPVVSLAACSTCHKFIAVDYQETWHNIDSFLEGENSTQNGLQTVTSPIDRMRLFVLSQVCHNQCDLDESLGESPYMLYAVDENARLMWKEGCAIGFTTVKCKGRPIGDNQWERFTMPVIDTVYIRKAWRGIGLGKQMVLSTLEGLAMGDVGFSYPIATGLMKVLKRLMVEHMDLRDRVWQCTYTGEEGYRENIWFSLVGRSNYQV